MLNAEKKVRCDVIVLAAMTSDQAPKINRL